MDCFSKKGFPLSPGGSKCFEHSGRDSCDPVHTATVCAVCAVCSCRRVQQLLTAQQNSCTNLASRANINMDLCLRDLSFSHGCSSRFSSSGTRSRVLGCLPTFRRTQCRHFPRTERSKKYFFRFPQIWEQLKLPHGLQSSRVICPHKFRALQPSLFTAVVLLNQLERQHSYGYSTPRVKWRLCRGGGLPVQYITVQYVTVQYSTVQYSTVRYNTVQYSTAQYSTVQYSTVRYSTVQYSTI